MYMTPAFPLWHQTSRPRLCSCQSPQSHRLQHLLSAARLFTRLGLLIVPVARWMPIPPPSCLYHRSMKAECLGWSSRYVDELLHLHAMGVNECSQILIGIFYAFAIIGAITRLVLQLRIHRRLHLDDYFLILAALLLTASTILGYIHTNNLYFSEDISLNPDYVFTLLASGADVVGDINAYETLYYTYPALLWTCIFAVKFAYLTFFRQLVDRVRPLVIYWRVVVGVTIVSYPICILSIYVACMKWGLEAGQWTLRPLHPNYPVC